jgi:DNA-3-methyladenine glycosylase
MQSLARSFYDRDPLEVAPELLGKVLVRATAARTTSSYGAGESPGTAAGEPPGVRMGRIVEVEAYRGEGDAASHAFRGRTPRCATMFGAPGRLYVYFTYGMHHCANVVCGPEGTAGAVLLRALEPVQGIEAMRDARFGAASGGQPADPLACGPGRLCKALGLDRSHDGADLVSGEQGIWVTESDAGAEPAGVLRGPRVGLGERVGAVGRSQLWRYWIDGNKSVSPPRTRGVPVRGRILTRAAPAAPDRRRNLLE